MTAFVSVLNILYVKWCHWIKLREGSVSCQEAVMC